MAFTQQNIIDKAVRLGGFDIKDTALMDKLSITAEMMIDKVSNYLGYDCTTVDALLATISEITVIQLSRYQNLTSTDNTNVKRISRGDYTVEYNDSIQTYNLQTNVLTSYEVILKKFKKLRSI